MITLQFFRRNPRIMRIMACTSMALFLSEILYPTAAMALTSGPAQPEFSSFEPVVTTNMVNDFTGDFTYNLPILQVPGPNGGGYPLSLSYHAGASPEEEASWVGFGWTLNPGAVNRQMRGFPDDWKGETVVSHNRAIPSKTVSARAGTNFEAGSFDTPIGGANATIRYNNYRGFGYTIGGGLTFGAGIATLGFSVSDGESSFSLTVNPGAILTRGKRQERKQRVKRMEKLNTGDRKLAKAAVNGAIANEKREINKIDGRNTSSVFKLNMRLPSASFPLSSTKMKGQSYSMSIMGNATAAPIEIGVGASVTGNYTRQANEPELDRKVYGYMYSGSVDNADAVMDYSVDNATPYNKRDNFLSVPINNSDVFVGTGEGITGGMRLHNQIPNRFRPDYTRSHTQFFNIGVEANFGFSDGGGALLGGGQQVLKTEAWKGGAVTDNGRAIMRMNGDRGGWLDRDINESTTDQIGFSLSGATGFKSSTIYDLNLHKRKLTENDKARSGFVGYSTNDEILDNNASGSVQYRAYEKTDLDKVVVPGNHAVPSRSSTGIGHHIGELSMVNTSGQRYTYGLPAKAKHDQSLSYGISSSTNIEGLSRAVSGDPSNSAFKSGTDSPSEYATAYLLTSITDPDYLDVDYDGPDDDDFGGYTTFKYERHATNYRWRMPYNGYAYSEGELSECHDDRIAYTAGEKDLYYLEKIETKTHYAIFHKSLRTDAYGAANEPVAGESYTAQNTAHTQKRLDKIELFAKADQSKPIKTVHFQYADPTEEAWKGVPNAAAGRGKLTLKRVWSEYHGIVSAKIAPYEFGYTYATYPDQSSGHPYQDRYADVQPPSNISETPNYGRFNSDVWGNYQDNGQSQFRADQRRTWVDQHPPATFDPAAWQLKRITLPSGGEVHVQYEQDDYTFVQDQRANGMVGLVDITNDHSLNPLSLYPNRKAREFRLDDADVEALRGNLTLDEYVDLIKKEFLIDKKRVYFKLRYMLTSGRDEYITGYAGLKNAAVHNNGINLIFQDDDNSLPVKVCRDLYRSQKRGKELHNITTGPCAGSGMPSDPADV